MSDGSTFGLPAGLPECLTTGVDGFNSLCALLGVQSRPEKQGLLNHPAVKKALKTFHPPLPPETRTAARMRHHLTYFYSLPNVRRDIWKALYESTDGFKDSALNFLPCLEYMALRNYGVELSSEHTADTDLSAYSDLWEISPALAKWQSPVLNALPAVRSDLEKWPSLEKNRQQEVTLATFAISSILDDLRLLKWAVEKSDDLSAEFSSFFENTVEPESGSEVSETERNVRSGDTREAVKEACESLIKASYKLVEAPLDAHLFDQVADRAKSVESLREAAVNADKVASIEALIETLVEFFERRTKGFPDLTSRALEIRKLWKSAYFRDLDSLREATDETRLRAEKIFDTWISARETADQADSKLKTSQEKLASAPTDADSELEVAKHNFEFLSAQKEVREAKQKIFRAMCPPEKKDQPSDDHSREPASLDATTTYIPEPIGNGDRPQAEPIPAPVAKLESSPEQRNDVADADTKDALATLVDTEEPGEESEKLPESKADRDEKLHLAKLVVALWESVRSDRMGIAYHIARLVPRDDDTTKNLPSAALIGAATLGTCLREPDSDIAQAFEEHAQLLLHGDMGFQGFDDNIRNAFNLMSFSAALRPAIFAPHTGGLPILQSIRLSGDLEPVYKLADAIAGNAKLLQRTVRFGADRLKNALDADAWDVRWEEHKNRVTEWRAALQNEKFLYGPARKVWQQWQQSGGILSDLINAVSGDSVDSIDGVRKILGTLSDHKKLHKLVQKTHRNELGSKGERIFGRGLKQIEGDAAKAVNLGRNWLVLMNSRPDTRDHADQVAEQLRKDISRLGQKAVAAIERAEVNSSDLPLTATLCCARRATEGLMALFKDGHDSPFSHGDSASALSHALLYVTALDISPDFKIGAGISAKKALVLLADTTAHVATMTEAFDERLSQKDITGAKAAHALLRMLRTGSVQDRKEREERLKNTDVKKRDFLYVRLDELSEKLEDAYGTVDMGDGIHDRLNASIVLSRNALNDQHPVDEVEKTTISLAKEIEEWVEEAIAAIRTRIEKFLPRDDKRERELLDDAFRSGDLVTLHEQIGRLEAGQPLLPKGHRELGGLRRFLNLAQTIEAESPTPEVVTRYVLEREDFCGLKFSSLSRQEAERSEKLIKLWFTLARVQKVDRNVLWRILSFLGFDVKSCEIQSNSVVLAETEPLRDRSICPLHTFGSNLNGRYEIFLNWRSEAHEPIIQSLSKESPTGRPLVLHFGHLGEGRESLLRWGAQNGRKFLVIDTTLLMYLASLPGNWLRVMFDCTLPFSAPDPFVTDTAGLVPPELFYGRARDRASIMDQEGSCFVYGGRQLGKTALLRSAEALFNEPHAGRLAKWLDLKGNDVGVAHGADHIWNVIWDALLAMGIIEKEKHPPRRASEAAKAASKAIGEWINAGAGRRILLLLDEADPFLAADAENGENGFSASVRLKRTMEDTDRRFKVVFSGLHNVLRTTEKANHPLAHFGTPICVGPLLHNGEWEQARALIREPLSATGCMLEKDSLITHILAWTNYYPSLIQLFGKELVNYLRGSARREFPYVVKMNDINAVWANENLRSAIFDKFRLTLGLDERYLVTACALAFELQGSDPARSTGLLQEELFELVCEWWPEGFQIPDREFAGLLEEMQGLGVLRAERDSQRRRRHAFRNPNMQRLLEEAFDIEAELTKEHALPDAFNKHTFHARYPSERPTAPRRAPLTFEQESLLKRGSKKGSVTVVIGNDAANIGQLEAYLEDSLRGGEHEFTKLELSIDVAEFEAQLGRQRPGDRAVHIYLAHENTQWNFRWLERTIAGQSRWQQASAMQVVFQASADTLWQFMSGLPEHYDEKSGETFNWIELRPWNREYLRRWCDDNNLLADTREVDALLDVSGGWPIILENYGKSSNGVGTKARIESVRKYVKQNADALLHQLGLGKIEVRRQVAALCSHKAFTESDADALSSILPESWGSEVDSRNLARRLRWAKRLSLIQNTGSKWFANPLLEKLLENTDA